MVWLPPNLYDHTTWLSGICMALAAVRHLTSIWFVGQVLNIETVLINDNDVLISVPVTTITLQ